VGQLAGQDWTVDPMIVWLCFIG